MKNYYTQTHEYLQKLASKLIQADRDEITWEGISVNLMEYGLLQELKRQEGETIQEMMEKTKRSRNEVTAMVRRLLKQQLIQKGPALDDRRVRRLILTNLGLQFVEAMENKTKTMVTHLLNDFSLNEEKAILKFLVRLDMMARSDELVKLRKRVGQTAKK